MSLIKRPSQLDVTATLSALVYGQPGCGKTTLACSAPRAVLFDFDGGVNRINGAHQIDTVQISSWKDVEKALEEVKASKDYDSIVVDTVGKMLAYMEEDIKNTTKLYVKKDGSSLTTQGYIVRKNRFIDFIRKVATMGKHVIFVAHEVEQKRNDETVIRPDINGTASAELLKELDLVGYVEMSDRIRTISFDPRDKFYAKNCCDMQGVISIPELIVDGQPVGNNDFFVKVIDAYHARLKKNKEETTRYEALCDTIRQNASEIENAEDANKFIEWIKETEHIYNSKAVALTALQAKAKALNLTFDKIKKQYA